jgi:ABC-2 type transport system ATP-binding protein/lipopolysaccharide transport system ATP-binding protein
MPSITLDDVCVDLPIYNSRGRSLKSAILAQTIGGRAADDRDQSIVVIRALNHVSLHIDHGARVALIGANGAGKTTLLRVIAKIYPPTRGLANVIGRIACLTDLNVGMDSEATGYENIRMRGVLLGLSRQEIAKLVLDVEQFTELGEFLKLPIRCYSQGMMLRLAFGISTAIQPEIILLDEIIGVGDQAFAERARQRLNVLIDAASILILASHDRRTITQLCSSALWLSHGRVVDYGQTAEVLDRYAKGVDGESKALKSRVEADTINP